MSLDVTQHRTVSGIWSFSVHPDSDTEDAIEGPLLELKCSPMRLRTQSW